MNLTNVNKPLDKIIDSFFSNSLSDLFGTDFIQNRPSVNILETDKEFQLQVAIPGFDKKEIQVKIEKDQLIISAESTVDEKEAFTKREFNYNSFKRSFHLSDNVNKEQIDAKYHEGILTIHLEKLVATSEASKVIKIK